MPSLTLKQELFAQKYIETGNASEAYRIAYDVTKMKAATVNREAKRLMDSPNISTRIAELRAQHMRRHEVTVDSITDELEEARTLALNIEQPGAAVTASMGKAKIHGMLVEKSELSGKDGQPIEVTDVSQRDLARRIAFLLTQASEQK